MSIAGTVSVFPIPGTVVCPDMKISPPLFLLAVLGALLPLPPAAAAAPAAPATPSPGTVAAALF